MKKQATKSIEMPIQEMLAKRAKIYEKLGGVATNQWNDLYGMEFYEEVPKGTVIVIKSRRSQNVCGVGVFSSINKLRMTPIYFADKSYDASKVDDELDVYIYNEKTNTMNLCVCSFYNRHDATWFGVLKQRKFYTNIEIKSIVQIGDEDIKF